MLNKEDATANAWGMVGGVFKGNPRKVPLTKKQLVEILEACYLMAAHNTTKEFYHYFRENPVENNDVLIGDIEVGIHQSFKNLRENPIGQKCTTKDMTIEEILENVHFKKFVKGKPKIVSIN